MRLLRLFVLLLSTNIFSCRKKKLKESLIFLEFLNGLLKLYHLKHNGNSKQKFAVFWRYPRDIVKLTETCSLLDLEVNEVGHQSHQLLHQ